MYFDSLARGYENNINSIAAAPALTREFIGERESEILMQEESLSQLCNPGRTFRKSKNAHMRPTLARSHAPERLARALVSFHLIFLQITLNV
jgi:hypothetical protein